MLQPSAFLNVRLLQRRDNFSSALADDRPEMFWKTVCSEWVITNRSIWSQTEGMQSFDCRVDDQRIASPSWAFLSRQAGLDPSRSEPAGKKLDAKPFANFIESPKTIMPCILRPSDQAMLTKPLEGVFSGSGD